jgi:hypothetical protein
MNYSTAIETKVFWRDLKSIVDISPKYNDSEMKIIIFIENDMPQIKKSVENSWYDKNWILKTENKKISVKAHIGEIDALIAKRKKCLK